VPGKNLLLSWLDFRYPAREMAIFNSRSILMSALLFVFLSGETAARERLRVAAWDGYADPEVVQAFERRHKVDVEVIQVDSDDDLWEKINRNNAADIDVFAVNTAELQRYIDRGLSIPLNLANIRNRTRQLERFRNLEAIPGVVRSGQTYAIPYTYAEMGLIYDQKRIKEPPRSISALWDPAYRGRVLAYNGSSHNFTLAAMLLGITHPFELDKNEFTKATRKLIDLRRNVLTFYSSPQDAVRLFIENDVVLVFANYGSQQLKALRDAGADVAYAVPSEGALAWLDCWSITRGVRNRKLAEDWINYTLEPSVSERLPRMHGLANTIEEFSVPRPHNKVVWLQPVENFAQRKQLWDRIISGDTFVE
jgi:putative spermidine/putrescine transport system substrate-binding protein